jgi:hypothetical protein
MSHYSMILANYVVLVLISGGFCFAAEAKVQLSDRFGVIGVIAQQSSPQSKQSLAVVRDSQSSRNLVVRVGDRLPGGFIVKAIRQNEVQITGNGEDFILSPKSFDGVPALASNDASREPLEVDDSDIEDEFVEPPPPGVRPGTNGERYRMTPGEVRESGPANTSEFPTTRRSVPPPPTQDGFGRSTPDFPEPMRMPPREAEFDDSFSGYEDLFEGP